MTGTKFSLVSGKVIFTVTSTETSQRHFPNHTSLNVIYDKGRKEGNPSPSNGKFS